MTGGIDDVGIGVLFGLETYRYDFIGLLMHAEHLEARFGVGPHTISVPRLCPADDIDTADFKNCVPDEIFHKIVAVLRIAVPYTGMIVSTRETPASREKVLELGVSQLSGGSRTSVGGICARRDGGELRPVRRVRPPFVGRGGGMAARFGLPAQFLHGLLP